MKKKIILCFLIIILMANCTILASTESNDIQNTENIIIEKGLTYSEDLFGFYKTIDIKGELSGNLAALSSKETNINGTIHGLTIIGSNSVSLNGAKFNRDVILMDATSIINNSMISDDLIAVSLYSFESDSSTVFKDDVYIYSAGSVILSGQIDGDVYIRADSVTLNAQINKNTTIYSDNIEISADTKISGDLNYYSTLNASIDSQAQISGEITHNSVTINSTDLEGKISGLTIGISVFKILLLVFLTWIFLLMCPDFINNAVTTLRKNPFISLLTGIGILFSILILSIFMVVSGILIVPGIFLLGTYSFLILISIIPFVFLIKSKVKGIRLYNFDVLVIISILFAISYIPIIGSVFTLILYGLGSGCIYIAFVTKIKQKFKLRKQSNRVNNNE